MWSVLNLQTYRQPKSKHINQVDVRPGLSKPAAEQTGIVKKHMDGDNGKYVTLGLPQRSCDILQDVLLWGYPSGVCDILQDVCL